MTAPQSAYLITADEFSHLLRIVAGDLAASGMVASLEESSDPVHKLALADWLTDHDFLDLAKGLRWAARKGRHPMTDSRRMFWYWESLQCKEEAARCGYQRQPCHILSRLILHAFSTRWLSDGGYRIGVYMCRHPRNDRHQSTLVLGSFLALAESLSLHQTINDLVMEAPHDELS